jgi:hypothetical protein
MGSGAAIPAALSTTRGPRRHGVNGLLAANNIVLSSAGVATTARERESTSGGQRG